MRANKIDRTTGGKKIERKREGEKKMVENEREPI